MAELLTVMYLEERIEHHGSFHAIFDSKLLHELPEYNEEEWNRLTPALIQKIRLFGTYSNTRSGKKHRKNHNKERQAYWKKTRQIVAFEDVEFIYQPTKDHLDVWIMKTEYW